MLVSRLVVTLHQVYFGYTVLSQIIAGVEINTIQQRCEGLCEEGLSVASVYLMNCQVIVCESNLLPECFLSEHSSFVLRVV